MLRIQLPTDPGYVLPGFISIDGVSLTVERSKTVRFPCT